MKFESTVPNAKMTFFEWVKWYDLGIKIKKVEKQIILLVDLNFKKQIDENLKAVAYCKAHRLGGNGIVDFTN